MLSARCREIWMADTRRMLLWCRKPPVRPRGRLFVETYGVKYDRAADRLTRIVIIIR